MFNKDKYPNNMKKFTIIPKWNMYTIKMNTQNERVIVLINAQIPPCLYPNTEYIRQVKYPNWRRYKPARIPKDYTQRT